MAENNDRSLRAHLIYLLEGGGAHISFDDALANMPEDVRGKTPPGLDHSVWDLLEHMRIAQWDILEFSKNGKHKSPKWPDEYWPKAGEKPAGAQWNESVRKFQADLKSMRDFVKNPKTDLFAKLPWGDGQTILREALLIADHNAYHLAQIVDARKVLGSWPAK
jgi:hypothetical protein